MQLYSRLSCRLNRSLIKLLLCIGEIPDDPSIGFLPPNNGTSGQGFVKFQVQASAQVEPLARIDANATIVFDENQPILTPPIFNTVRRIS